MQPDEQQRLILAFIAGSICTTALTLAVTIPTERKFQKRFKTIILSQRNVIQWVDNHALELDRDEFAKKFLEQVTFYNIVVEES